MKLSSQEKSKLNIALIMIALAIIVLITGTYAWFTLSLSGKVNTMDLQVTTGDYLRIDTSDRGNNIENWSKSVLDAADIEKQLGVTLEKYTILPVTSGNGTKMYTRSGNEVATDKRSYLQFDLYFVSNKDVNVYLTEENSADGNDGTKVISNNTNSTKQASVVDCVRISFAEGNSSTGKIYEPAGVSNTKLTVSNAISDGGQTQSTFSNAKVGQTGSNLFKLTANQSKKITVRIWIEGDDKDCTSDVELSKFQTRLRFEAELSE